MKRKKIILILLLVLVIFGIAFLRLRDFSFLNLDGPDRVTLNNFPFIVILSLIISTLLILIFENRLDFWTLFNFSWVLVLVFIFCQILITYDYYMVFDYTFSDKITNYKMEKYDDESSKITRFIVDSDTLYHYQNSKTQKIYEGEFNLYKSKFQKFYYLTKKD